MKKPDIDSIERTLANMADEEEARVVVKWFETTQGQEWLKSRMEQDLMTITNENAERITGHEIPSEEMYEYVIRKIRRRKLRRIMISFAAVLLPFILLVLFVKNVNDHTGVFNAEEFTEVSTSAGDRLLIAFQDGSQMYLNNNSTARYPLHFGYNSRRIFLSGEAWFKVTPNKDRPFIVDVPALTVKVLGTEFSVRAYCDEIYSSVTLENGSTEISLETGEKIKLSPGDQIIYNRETHTCDLHRLNDPVQISSWREGIIHFNDTPLKEVLRDIERLFDVKFKISDKRLSTFTYTMTVNEKSGLQEALNDMRTISPVLFEQKDSIIIVYPK